MSMTQPQMLAQVCLYLVYCEIIINRGLLIFVDFVVHLNNEN